ncbi:MAG TPA: peptidylprolyl isomerase [Vicinamibacterales bacterium]|jgi:peptidyl-prolyl cis-trans isomerase B (cyclophilin B)|nr:peptidylprolyl isomerase [Vicinamibacterales bacterium]
MLFVVSLLLVAIFGASDVQAQARRSAPATTRDPFFTSTIPVAELRNQQAVIETSQGTIVLDLLADAAPNHVAYFIGQARAGAYDGTVFHRVIPMGIVQGGDPLSKDPAQSARYGSGGLGKLRFETNTEKHTRGAVSAVLVPGQKDSAGSQFFICVTDQPALDGQYTVFARVAEGINVAQKISTRPSANGIPAERIEIHRVTIRERPPDVPEPFANESMEELGKHHAIIETSLGNIEIAFFPDKAPNHVRQFLRLAQLGVYDGTTFHRVVPGFVVQGGYLATRKEPLDEKQERAVRPLQPEFNDTLHERGIVSMAHLTGEPASATTSFFIVLDRAERLDGQYTVFGHVVSGMDVVEQMEKAPVNGETPVMPVTVTRVRVE